MSDPRKWMKSCLDKWSGNHKFGKVEENYLKCFKQPKRIHGSCEEYRASATIDLDHDKKDRKKKQGGSHQDTRSSQMLTSLPRP